MKKIKQFWIAFFMFAAMFLCTVLNVFAAEPGAALEIEDAELASASNPYGYLESSSGGNGTITVHGWAYDSDNVNTSLEIHVYIGRSWNRGNAVYGTQIKANKLREDVNNTMQWELENTMDLRKQSRYLPMCQALISFMCMQLILAVSRQTIRIHF